jgi:hypothetical protein
MEIKNKKTMEQFDYNKYLKNNPLILESLADRLLSRKKSPADNEQIDVLSSVLHFMPDEVVEAGEELEKELRKAGVKLETNGYLIDAIKDLVLAARHSK